MEKSGREYCSPSGRISETCCDYETVEGITNKLAPTLYELTRTPFFKYVKMDLNKGCSFWDKDDKCNLRSCAVKVEKNMPERWSKSVVDMNEFTPANNLLPFKRYTIPDKDFCVLEDEMSSEGSFVDLTKNPERFTGYTGEGSWRIWSAIYEENCFGMVKDVGIPEEPFATSPKKSDQLPPLLKALGSDQDQGSVEVCTEKRIFYRILSGLHASISIHICDEHFNHETNQWEHNLDCFITRIGKHPERLQNVYFNYVLLLRAVTKMAPFLENYRFGASDAYEDSKIKRLMNQVVQTTMSCPSTFDENTLFNNAGTLRLKDEFKHHFRNISRIMDCVGCEKCRLWGKIQTSGIGTALKILFSYNDDSFNAHTRHDLLSHYELVTLMNTLARFSESLEAVERFRNIYQERLAAERLLQQRLEREKALARLPEFIQRLRAYIISFKEYMNNWTCRIADGFEAMSIPIPSVIDPRPLVAGLVQDSRKLAN
ncbi:hypothetical protein BDF19DRAFT_407447 [Syncephalis fuscata]|nr:hypothetical protein BDF19DRAFT_407447 [Syncephalis fuscata]